MVSCRENITVFEEKSDQGTIYVDSNPLGAYIYLNNKFLDKTTPDSIAGLDPGIYFVSLYKPGYKDTTIEVELKPKSHPYVNVKF